MVLVSEAGRNAVAAPFGCALYTAAPAQKCLPDMTRHPFSTRSAA